MSLQPLRITAGRKLAAGLAGIITMSATLTSGFAASVLTFRPGPADPLSQKLLFGTLAIVVAIISVAVSFLLVRAALGRIRTGGSLSRFFRYQLAAFGVGGGLGLGFLPAMTGAAPIWWVISIAAGVGLIAVSLLAFRKARYPILSRPPYPHIGLAEGRVIGDWSAAHTRGPSLTVVHFVDDKGRERWVRHLVQQSPSLRGTVGQVVYDRHRPERVQRFAVTQQLFDIRPPREIRENPAPQPRTIYPMPPGSRPPRPR
ncbi:hypothetical protein [Brevibacterium linens]|uniref:Uncharacterized protein n=1 Tax=Brevibacterium linens ATCC 9172 TaxID=1255617 RepID=A0A2H1J0C8_BRELN|nr:hypothetical protein [Brevibacterium linens]KAB1945526.1 hypothetical protein F8227_13795 [Brevibacterium linens ATCC 9172]SMX80925.1 hypothetical protein BLIN9172_01617 [Brevibacterium linens ATCC 9172]